MTRSLYLTYVLLATLATTALLATTGGCTCGAPEPLSDDVAQQLSEPTRLAYEKIVAANEPGDRRKAASELGALGLRGDLTPGDYALVPTLRKMASSGDASQREAGLIALRPFLHALQREKIENPDDAVRARADEVLATCTEHLDDGSEAVRVEAVKCVRDVKRANTIDALLPLLEDASWRVRYESLTGLRGLRELDEGGRIVKAARPLLQDSKQEVRDAAKITLAPRARPEKAPERQ